MKLLCTLLVRDEEDILETFLNYHLSQGVDFFIVTDNLSADGTKDILLDYERRGVVQYIYEPADNYAQGCWVTRMAEIAYLEHQADWIIHSDADEFWWPERHESLRAHFKSVRADLTALEVSRSNFLNLTDSDDRLLFWQRMIYRQRSSCNALNKPLPPKVCHRGHSGVIVSQGNHRVHRNGISLAQPTNDISIFHFPERSFHQFQNKIMRGGAAYERNVDLPIKTGNTWRILYQLYKTGGLLDYWEQSLVSPQDLEAGLQSGDLIRDVRLRDYLSALFREHLESRLLVRFRGLSTLPT